MTRSKPGQPKSAPSSGISGAELGPPTGLICLPSKGAPIARWRSFVARNRDSKNPRLQNAVELVKYWISRRQAGKSIYFD